MARPAGRARLTVSRPDDRLEREADRIADRVIAGGSTPKVTGATAPAVQRTCSACEEEEQTVQRRADGSSSAASAPAGSVDAVLASPGRPLDAATRAFMEPRFGHDFSRIRIHSDDRAGASARALRAEAYTVGDHIAFAPGRYDPSSATGKHLLAHELAHTLQQADGAPMVQRRVVCPPGVDPEEGTGCYCAPDETEEEGGVCEAPPAPAPLAPTPRPDPLDWLRDHPDLFRPRPDFPPFRWPRGGGLPGQEGDYSPECPSCHDRHPNMRPRPRPRIVESCATEMPGIPLCASLPSEYIYPSAGAALEEMKRVTGKKNLKLHNKSPTTGGPCPEIGTHWNVRDGNERVGSIACCPCCTDTTRGPIRSTLCRIIW